MPRLGNEFLAGLRLGFVRTALVWSGCWVLGASWAAPPSWGDDFRERVAPLLNKNCVACHNAKNAEGGLNLESYEPLLAGGDSGDAVVAGDADSSELIARVLATDDSVMPPDDNGVGAERLTAEEAAVIAQWINGGALPPSGPVMPAIQWRTISQNVQPIYALDWSADGHYLTFAKGNVAYLVAEPLAEGPWDPIPLLDDSLPGPDGTPLAATDKDLVHALAFSHDSQRLAVGGFRTVKLWERDTRPRTLAPVPAADFTILPTQGLRRDVLATDNQQHLQLWNPDTGQFLQSLGPAPATIVAAAWGHKPNCLSGLDSENRLWQWLPNDDDPTAAWTGTELPLAEPLAPSLTVATGSENELWVVQQTGRVLKILPDGEVWRAQLAFDTARPLRIARISDDARWLVAVGEDASTTIWSMADGRLAQTLGEDYERLQRRQQSQQQIARHEGWIKRFTEMLPGLEEEVKKEEAARAKVAEQHQNAVAAQQAKLQEVAAAQQLVSESEQAIAALEQQLAEKRQQLADQQKAAADLQAQTEPLEQNVAKALQALASADAGLQLARDKVPAHQARIESRQRELGAAQAASEEFLAQPLPDVAATTFNSDGTQVLLIDNRGHGRLYRVDSGLPLAVLPPPTELPAGTTMQTGCSDAGLAWVRTPAATWRWDMSLPWHLVKTWGNEQDELFSFRVTALAFSPDDQQLAVGSGPPSRFGDLKVLSLATGQLDRDYGQVHSDTILALQYSPDGRWLASAGADKLCRLHDPGTGEMVKILEGHTHFVQGLSWQPHGQSLATASADKTVKTWDVETGERRQSIAGFGKEISAIAYVSDTDQLMTVALDGQTRLHRSDNAQLVRSFTPHAQPLYALTMAADGKHVIVGAHDGILRIFRVEDGQSVKQWPPSGN
jgi:WD40 repeat protein